MSDFKQQYALWDEFLSAWPLSRLATITLDEYSPSGSKDSFAKRGRIYFSTRSLDLAPFLVRSMSAALQKINPSSFPRRTARALRAAANGR